MHDSEDHALVSNWFDCVVFGYAQFSVPYIGSVAVSLICSKKPKNSVFQSTRVAEMSTDAS